MTLDNFYALTNGKAPLDVYEYETKTHKMIDANVTSFLAGEVNVPSGLLAASDPYVEIENPLVFEVAAGKYPVYVTVADVSNEQNGSHHRECYLSVILNDNVPVTVVGALPKGKTDDDLSDGTYYGVGVDAGMVGFFDAEAGKNLNDSLEDPDDLFDFLEEGLTEKEGASYGIFNPENIEGNFVYSHSGWGDGFYPVKKTLDAEGNITGLHIDLGILGTFEDD